MRGGGVHTSPAGVMYVCMYVCIYMYVCRMYVCMYSMYDSRRAWSGIEKRERNAHDDDVELTPDAE